MPVGTVAAAAARCAWPARSTALRRNDCRPTMGALAPLRTDIADPARCLPERASAAPYFHRFNKNTRLEVGEQRLAYKTTLMRSQVWDVGMLALFALGFSLPLDPWRSHPLAMRPLLRPREGAFPPLRRAPLAEHGWEERVLRNLTRSN
jgi:hypothetical protein